jgi:hypothetical protein
MALDDGQHLVVDEARDRVLDHPFLVAQEAAAVVEVEWIEGP